MATLNDLNMQYVNAIANEEIDGGAILECSRTWSIEKITQWLPNYDYDMLWSVEKWLSDDAQIAEGQYLKVWIN